MTRNQKILQLRGTMSYSLIAERLGISRGAVAGVCFRDDYCRTELVGSPHSHGGNKVGNGLRGGAHEYAPVRLCHSGSGKILTTGAPT